MPKGYYVTRIQDSSNQERTGVFLINFTSARKLAAKIKKVAESCGCDSPDNWRFVDAPHSFGYLELQIMRSSFPNESKANHYVATLSGAIWKEHKE